MPEDADGGVGVILV